MHTDSLDAVCVGEAMAQLAPLAGRSVAAADSFQLHAAGAESNVALGLVQLGHRAAWAGRVGADALGRRLVAEYQRAGVATHLVTADPERRTGLFIKDPGPHASTVTYYRDGSAASALDIPDIDTALTARPRLVHTSGITPALSASCRRAAEYLIHTDRPHRPIISFDVNYRPVLWPDQDTAAQTLRRLAAGADIVFVGLDEAQNLWGVTTAGDVRELLPEVPYLVVKDGSRDAREYSDAPEPVIVPAKEVDVLEPVGAGDAFAAGWLHGFLHRLDTPIRLRLGHLMAARALESISDYSHLPVSVDELWREAGHTAPPDRSI